MRQRHPRSVRRTGSFRSDRPTGVRDPAYETAFEPPYRLEDGRSLCVGGGSLLGRGLRLLTELKFPVELGFLVGRGFLGIGAGDECRGSESSTGALHKSAERLSGDRTADQEAPAGKKFVFLQCSTPVCALAGKLLQPAVKAIGGTFTAVDAGTTAQASQAAASSVLALKPDAVLYSGSTPALFGGGLKAISGAGIKVVSISISTDVKPYGITFNYIGPDTTQLYGKLLADWVVVNKGAIADAVSYGVPALDLSPSVQKAFEDELHKNCASCKARTVPIDASTIGKTSAATVVSDLQAHPSTNVAVFVSFQVAAGLPAAMKIAGLSVPTVGFAPTPGNLQDLKNGGLTAALAIDFPVSVWTAVDAAARLIQGAQPTSGEEAGEVPLQFLAKKDITFDPTNGWSGYPDFSQRFAMLWQTS